MADPEQQSTGEERDQVSELPHSPTMPSAHPSALADSSRVSQESVNEKASHTHTQHCNHSNVDVGFFDPAGVHQLGRTLSRTLSRMSQDQAAIHAPGRSVASSSNETIVNDGFSLEKTLGDLLKRCVFLR